jgi:hypothetical protein
MPIIEGMAAMVTVDAVMIQLARRSSVWNYLNLEEKYNNDQDEEIEI